LDTESVEPSEPPTQATAAKKRDVAAGAMNPIAAPASAWTSVPTAPVSDISAYREPATARPTPIPTEASKWNVQDLFAARGMEPIRIGVDAPPFWWKIVKSTDWPIPAAVVALPIRVKFITVPAFAWAV
jgi:hypothetical protein